MAEHGDIIDELLEIQNDWNAISSPLSHIADTLTGAVEETPYNPADYKGKPRIRAHRCVQCSSHDPEACTLCQQVCPVDAIRITPQTIYVDDEICRRCGLCSSVCPTEALTDHAHEPLDLYTQVAAKATSHERCYVTCTRALGRKPEENEVVLGCVGAVPAEAWMAILEDFDNVEVFLPIGICQRCQTTTGEQVYMEAISLGETATGSSLGLEVEADKLSAAKKHSWERREFVESMKAYATQTVTANSRSYQKLKRAMKAFAEHQKDLEFIEETLGDFCEQTSSANKLRRLTQRRELLLSAVAKDPSILERTALEVPYIDPDLCTECGACAASCPTGACELDEVGNFRLEAAYCTGCNACVAACPEGALELDEASPVDFSFIRRAVQQRKIEDEKQAQEAEKLKEESREKLLRNLDFLEQLGF